MYTDPAVQLTTVVDPALSIENVVVSSLPLWFVSPPKVKLADAVFTPALMLFV
ncbi:hypothetical protein D3C83_268830 [compost metagenome]